MWPGLVPLLQQSVELSFASVVMITNAIATPPRVLRAIESSNLSRICISLDGLAEVHDRNRGPGAGERALAGIRALREVHDNLTVISVIDTTNHRRWPELTRVLSDLGVTAHHLAPVCMAGHAMTDYRGLTVDQFAEVRELVDRTRVEVPEVRLEFNDVLVRPPATRTMPLYQMTEQWKGWHRIVRPDGDVRTQIRAWGRSWRTNESQGNIHSTSLAQILASRAHTVAPFVRAEEVARKFHLGADAPLILADLHDVDAVAHGTGGSPGDQPNSARVPAPELLGVQLAELAAGIRNDPHRYRIREEDDFALLFDTRTDDVMILRSDEFASLSVDLVEVPA